MGRPFRALIARQISLLRFRTMSMEQVFLYIWRHQNWGASETVSGHGPTLAHTGMLRAALPSLFRELRINGLLDIPCGAYNWMSPIRPSVEAYIGSDIV